VPFGRTRGYLLPLRRKHFPHGEGVPSASRAGCDVGAYSYNTANGSLVHDNGLRGEIWDHTTAAYSPQALVGTGTR
jgi:hypothetical protein